MYVHVSLFGRTSSMTTGTLQANTECFWIDRKLQLLFFVFSSLVFPDACVRVRVRVCLFVCVFSVQAWLWKDMTAVT